MNGKRVLVYGEALVDFVPAGEGSQHDAILGGSGFNTALALARCGADVSYNATVSRDALGQLFRSRMVKEGIDQSLIGDSDAPTPSATIEGFDAEGAAQYRFRMEDTAFAMPPPEPGDLLRFAHLHVTSFGATAGVSGSAALALMRRARKAGLSISYDLNIRLAVLSPDDARCAIEERIALCDLVKFSADDAADIFLNDDCNRSARWFANGLTFILMTAGDEGAGLLSSSCEKTSAFVPASEVVNTIGAGDSFMGAFLASLALNGGLGQTLRALPVEMSAAAMDFDCRVAAETCGEKGCNPPKSQPPPACE